MKTRNLTILFTDIVGFTSTTARQSRQENEELLNRHNRLLLPIVEHFNGELIKTIGDALLLVFSSPTDAMLCSMAMQDALFDHNRTADPEKQIHIRIAANLGEVRVAENDIFGDPVNLASRIESITPADEIYFSDAVYMTMNKAEVPCIEVGRKTLKGIGEPVRIWQIPRFSKPRLIPEEIMEGDDISDIAFPYGGSHLIKFDRKPPKKSKSPVKTLIVVLAVTVGVGAIIAFSLTRKNKEPEVQPFAEQRSHIQVEQQPQDKPKDQIVKENSEASKVTPGSDESEIKEAPPESVPTQEKTVETVEEQPSPPVIIADSAPSLPQVSIEHHDKAPADNTQENQLTEPAESDSGEEAQSAIREESLNVPIMLK